MCLISTEIETVSNTKILVAPNYNNTRQLTVYSNFISNISESNAMVLPVPLPQTLQFINLSGYKNLFEDCAKCFYNPQKSFIDSYSVSTNSLNTKDDKPLQVFNIGSYQVSVAMNLDQISRVDSQVFELSSGLSQTLKTFYYQEYWGFIICKLNSGPESYHPLAYSHQIIDNKIYIPTRHYHQEVKWADVNNWALGTHIDPKQNPLNARDWNEDNINQSPMFKTEKFGPTTAESNGWANLVDSNYQDNMGNYSTTVFETPTSKFVNNNDINTTQLDSNFLARMSSRFDNLKKLNDIKRGKYEHKNQHNQQTNSAYKKIADDWSHSIYLMNLNPQLNEQLLQMNISREIWDRRSLFDPEKIRFDFGRCDNFFKIKIEGSHPNIDLVIPISV